jgi:hypothetical protein
LKRYTFEELLRDDDGSLHPEGLMLLRYKNLKFLSRDEFYACCRLRFDYLVYMRDQSHYERQNDYLITKLTQWKLYKAAMDCIPVLLQRLLLDTVLDNLPVGRPERFPKEPPPEMIDFKRACAALIMHYQCR